MKEVIIKPKKQKNRGKETRRTEDFAEAENQRDSHTDEGEAGETGDAHRRRRRRKTEGACGRRNRRKAQKKLNQI